MQLGCTLSGLSQHHYNYQSTHAANIPVGIPHPSRQTLSSAALGFTCVCVCVSVCVCVCLNLHFDRGKPYRDSLSSITLATEISGSTVYSLKVEVPMKWKRVWPRQENRDEPSGINPLPWVDL